MNENEASPPTKLATQDQLGANRRKYGYTISENQPDDVCFVLLRFATSVEMALAIGTRIPITPVCTDCAKTQQSWRAAGLER